MTDDRQIRLSAKNIYKKDGGVYFFNIDFNSLFRFDLDNYSVRHLHAFLEYQTEEMILFGDFVVENEDELFFFPGSGNFIGIYNTQLDEGKKVIIRSECDVKEEAALGVAKIIVSGKKVWIFLADTSLGVYILDMETHQIQKDFELSQEIKKYQPLVWKLEQAYDNCSFVQTGDLNLLLQIDIDRKIFIERKTPVRDGIIIGDNGRQIWLYVANSTKIYEWAVETDELSVYSIVDKELIYESEQGEMPPYARCVCFDDDVYILGWSIKAIMKLNKEEKTIDRAFAFPENFYFYEYKKVSFLNSSFWSVEMIEGKLYFFPCGGNMLLIYDLQSGKAEGKEIVIDKGNIFNYEKMITYKLFKEQPQSETDNFFSIYDFLEYAQNRHDPKTELKEDIGKRIWVGLNDE